MAADASARAERDAYEERLAQILADAAPRLDTIQVEHLRGLLAPMLREPASVASVVSLPPPGAPEPSEAPERAA